MDNPGADRSKHANEHLVGVRRNKASGLFLSGGQINDESTPRKAIGSHLQIRCGTKEEVLEILRNDPFTKGGVWNMDIAKVYHLKCVYREKLEMQI